MLWQFNKGIVSGRAALDAPPTGGGGKTIDGHAHAQFSTTNSGTVTLTTTLTDDIIVLQVHCEKGSATQTVSSVSGGGLTWAKRSSLAFNVDGNINNNMEVWWAHAASPLSAAVVTVTLSAATDDASLIIFGVNGCASFTTPWDTNVSLPATNDNLISTTSTPSVSGVSTTSGGVMVLAFYGTGSHPNMPTAGSGYTIIDSMNNGGGTNFSYSAAEQQSFASAQSSISVAFTGTFGEWGVIADALV
jgi:hypothetical protein